jgi:hypothetical protein
MSTEELNDTKDYVSEDYVLDEEYHDIKETLKNIENPDVLNIGVNDALNVGLDFDDESLTEMKKKIKSMPRDELYKLMEKFSSISALNNNNFGSVNNNNVISSKQKLQERLSVLKLKRSSKQTKEHLKVLKEKELETSKNKKVDDVVETTVDVEKEDGTESESKHLSQSQKKRLREKKKKLQTVISE